MSDDDLITRLRANGLDECDEAIALITDLKVELAKGAIDYCALMERRDAEFVRAEKAEAERDAAVEALELLHSNVVQAWPSLADLGPVAKARATLAKIKEGKL